MVTQRIGGIVCRENELIGALNMTRGIYEEMLDRGAQLVWELQNLNGAPYAVIKRARDVEIGRQRGP